MYRVYILGRFHTFNKPLKLLICEHCNKVFDYKSFLKRHLKGCAKKYAHLYYVIQLFSFIVWMGVAVICAAQENWSIAIRSLIICTLAFVHFAGFLVNPLMPDLVIDRALGYVNLLPLFWLWFLSLSLCNFSPLFSPLLLRWHDHKSKQRRLCDTSSARGQLRNFGLWIGSWDPTDHVTFLPSSHPQLFTSYEMKRRRKEKKKNSYGFHDLTW